ncbi:hypothetical protein V6C59_20045 [Acinetobacter bereziniae]|uniref:hypothetical protein n=1 Tax=Acinetobacter bereziniae TaxID=106648 RepID=UPI002FD8B36E
MLQPIPIELILTAQQLVTAYGSIDECRSYSGYLNDGSAYLRFYGKLPMTVSPHVEIKSFEDHVSIMVYVMDDHNALTGQLSDDYKYFISLTNRIYSPEEFIQACRDFWFNKGKSDLGL